jgi:signal transduction histidine kinase
MTRNNSDTPIRLLLVDDEQMSADMLMGMFAGDPGVTVRFVSDPAQALQVAHAFEPSVMLVDLRMPGVDGLELIYRLRGDPFTAAIPLLMLSTEIDPHVKAAGFAAGAADYLVKWPDRVELTARVRAHAHAYQAGQERDRAAAALAESRDQLLRRTEELALAQAALHEAQKMEAIGQLTSAVAHDVNNILHLINGHLQLMRIEHPDERSLRRIDAATEGVKRGAQLTSQLLATARGKPQTSQPVDLAIFLRGIEATVLNAPDAQPCRLELAEGAHCASLDPIELQKILVELVKNAREASGGGPVSVLLDSEQVSNRTGRVPPGSYVRIRVVDTGEGMEPEVQRRAFEPFFSTKHGVQGAGLGLSLAAGFARRHQGHIDLESRVGEGTQVTLRFPKNA